jgi:hypothetical protein
MVQDETAQTKPPCPRWCHRHWDVGPGIQHVSTEVRYPSGTVQAERFDTPTTEGLPCLVIQRDDGEPLAVSAIDVLPLIGALYAVWAEAGK